MDGLHELTAGGLSMTIAGETYRLLPLRARDWAEAARMLAARRPAPLDVVKRHLAGLSEALQRELIERAYRDERDGDLLPIEQIETWLRTPEGRAVQFWMMLRRARPEVTLEQAEDLLLAASEEERAALARSEKDNLGLPLGNCSGPAKSRASRQRVSRGVKSSGSSAVATGGRRGKSPN